MLRVVVVLVLILAILLLLFGPRLQRLTPQQLRAGLKRGLLILVAGAAVVLALSGRLHWLFGVLGGMLPLAQRAMVLWRASKVFRRFRSGGGRAGPSGQDSQVQTRYLRMHLDHATGALSGTVLDGRYKGSRLEDLDRGALLELLRECRVEDDESARLLEAYLDRTLGDTWRRQAGGESDGGRPQAGGSMTREEALAVLGLQPGADAEQIRLTHRRLMQKLHPDRGGSDYLAAKINQAKDLLLGGE